MSIGEVSGVMSSEKFYIPFEKWASVLGGNQDKLPEVVGFNMIADVIPCFTSPEAAK
jgi:hypothetical protein